MNVARPLRLLIVAALLSAAAVARAAAEGGPPLTLARAIELALADNPDLEATRIRGLQIQAMLDESKAAFLPWVGINYSFNTGDWPHIMIAQAVDARSFPENGFFNFPGDITVYSGILETRMNLWAGGRDRARRSLLTTATEICGTENEMARNRLTGEVVELFYEVLAATERLGHAEQLVETVRTRLDESRERFAAGALLGSELADVEARLAEAEAGVAHVAAGRLRSLAALAIAMGLPAAADLELADTPDEANRLPQPPANHDEGLAQALDARPELARARLMNRRFELGVKIAEAELKPKLDTYWAVGSYEQDDPRLHFDSRQLVWYGNVMLSFELFDGGARRARIAKAKAELDEFREVDRQTTLGVELDVRTAYLRIDEARARLAAAESRLRAARLARDVRRAQHEAGAATLASALEGDQLATDALMGRTNAAFELKKALAGASRAVGLFAASAGGTCCSLDRP